MIDLKQHVTQKCIDIIDQKRWRPFRDFSVEFVKDQPVMFMAGISIASRQIKIVVAEDADKILNEFTIEAEIERLIDEILYFLVVHEHSHHMICPKTKDSFQDIIAGAYDIVSTKECRKDRIEAACFNIHNMFSDTILNVINSHTDTEKQSFRQGLISTYETDHFYQVQKRPSILGFQIPKMFVSKADKAMTLFMRSNFLMSTVDREAFDRVNFRYLPIAFLGGERYLRKLITVFTDDDDLTEQFISGDVDVGRLPSFLNRLQDRLLWKPMTVEYTKIIYRFMNQRYNQLGNSFSDSKTGQGAGQGMPGNQQSQSSNDKKKGDSDGNDKPKKDKGAGGRDDKKKDDKKDSGSGSKKNDNGSDKKNPVKDFLEKLEQQLKDSLPTPSSLLLKYPHLDDLYKRRAGKLMLSAEVGKGLNPQYDYHYGKTEMSLNEFEFKNVDWSSTVVTDDNIMLHKRDIPFTLPFEVDVKEGSLPDLAFIFDSSISMTFDPLAGVGEYHYAVLAFYSIIAGLEAKSLAYYLKYYAMNFSSRSISSGWQSHNRLDVVKKAIFDYQGTGTVLDPAALRDLRENRSDNVIAFMLSDTDFNYSENIDALLHEIDMMIDCGGIGLYLFQLGAPTRFSSEVEKRGIPVQRILSAQDFMNKSIQFTKDLYGELVT